jgi:hypothetical protein
VLRPEDSHGRSLRPFSPNLNRARRSREARQL